MVEGVAQLKRRFKQIPERIRKVARVELERWADDVVSTMRTLVPVDTGSLRDSIRWTWGAVPSGSTVLGEVKGNSNSNLVITIYAGGGSSTRRSQRRDSGTRVRDQGRQGHFDVDVAKLQEFGTSKMPANPYFYPAWRSNKRRGRSRLTRAINKEVRTMNGGK